MPMNRHPASNDVPPVFRYLVQQYAIELANAQVDTAALTQELDEALRGKLYHEEISRIRSEQVNQIVGMVNDLNAFMLTGGEVDVKMTASIRNRITDLYRTVINMSGPTSVEEEKGEEDCGCGNHDAGRHRPDGPGSDQQD